MNEFTNQNESTGTTRAHNVAHGESLWSIAKNDLLSQTDRVTNKDIALEVLKIERENNFRNPDRIKVNDQMFLPSLYLSDSGKGGLSDAPSPPLSAAFIHSVLRSVQEPTSTPASDAPAPDSSAATPALESRGLPPIFTAPDVPLPTPASPAYDSMSTASIKTAPDSLASPPQAPDAPPVPAANPAPDASPPTPPTPTPPGALVPDAAGLQPPVDSQEHQQETPHAGEDFWLSLFAGQIGRNVATKVMQVGLFAAEKNPWVRGAVLGATVLGGTALAREGMDQLSHMFIHTKRLTPSELAVQSLAGGAGAIVSKDLPGVFGSRAGGILEKTVTGGASWAAVEAGLANPLTTDPLTGKHFTVGRSVELVSGQFIDGAAFGSLSGGTKYVFNKGKAGVNAAIDWLKPGP